MNRPYEEYLHAIEIVEELYNLNIYELGAMWGSETGEAFWMECDEFVDGLLSLKAYLKKKMGMEYEIPDEEETSCLSKVIDGERCWSNKCPVCGKRYYTDVMLNLVSGHEVCNECGEKRLQERTDKDDT